MRADGSEIRKLLEPLAGDLEATLRTVDADASVVLTGSAVYRDDQLAGIRRAMLLALPLALVACLAVAALFMRSLRYALMSVIPIVLVVIWLFGIMHLAGYSINVVTAIIGAISIGIGIDFSTHFVMRFLEEMDDGALKGPAIAAAGEGTGAALAGSAVTSVAGFGILAFAPMPMFATYGLLTALMIVLALLAALFVLPSLLVAITTDGDLPVGHRRAGRVLDLREGSLPAITIGLARDLSDGVVAKVVDVLEDRLRQGEVTVRTVAGDNLPGLLAAEKLDLGLVVRWPGGAHDEQIPGIETLPVGTEDLVVVGAPARPGGAAGLDELVSRLIVAGPHPEFEEGVVRLLETRTESPVLAHTVGDVVTGLRIAQITGGAMVLPRSMAASSALPARHLEPPAAVETVLLARSERTVDEEIFSIVMALHEALLEDGEPAPSVASR